jgi:hypothetical protein
LKELNSLYPDIIPNNWKKCKNSSENATLCIKELQSVYPNLIPKNINLPSNLMGIVLNERKDRVTGVVLADGKAYPLDVSIPYFLYKEVSGENPKKESRVSSHNLSSHSVKVSPPPQPAVKIPTVTVPKDSKKTFDEKLNESKQEGNTVDRKNFLEQVRNDNRSNLKKPSTVEKKPKTEEKPRHGLANILDSAMTKRRKSLEEAEEPKSKKTFCEEYPEYQLVYNESNDTCVPISGGKISDPELEEIDKIFQDAYPW